MIPNYFYILISATFVLALVHTTLYSTNISIIPESFAEGNDRIDQEISNKNITNQTLGEPFYSENGIITGPYTYTANGTLKDVGNVTNTELIIIKLLSDELIFGEGQGVLKSQDGSKLHILFSL
jgi:hypothetical protein